MTLAGKKVEVQAGTFIHLPSWCEHGVENTGDETLEILICTSPPNPFGAAPKLASLIP